MGGLLCVVFMVGNVMWSVFHNFGVLSVAVCVFLACHFACAVCGVCFVCVIANCEWLCRSVCCAVNARCCVFYEL